MNSEALSFELATSLWLAFICICHYTTPHANSSSIKIVTKATYNINHTLIFLFQNSCNFPDFDFHVPGVSSMSLDTHKYGYALKGTSVLLYKNRELRQAQYFCYADWTGGLYTTPTLAGKSSAV